MPLLMRWFSNRRVQAVLLTLFCVAVAFATRHQYLHQGFFKDDYDFLGRGPLTLAQLPRIFNPATIGWFYRPVFLLWIQTFNLLTPANSVVLHGANILLFGLTVSLAGILVYRLTNSTFAVVATSIIFMYAPWMEEAIWWISSGSTLLAGLFSLIALHLWLTWRIRGNSRRLVPLILLCMVLALFSKEDAATLPLVLLVFDWYLAKREGTRLTFSNIRFIWGTLALITMVYGVLDLAAYHYVNILTNYGATNVWEGITIHTFNLAAGIGSRSLAFGPFGGQNVLHSQPFIEFLVFVACLLILSRRKPLLFHFTIIAILGVLPTPLASGQHAVSPRFMYVPNMYGAILAGILFCNLFASKTRLVVLLGVLMAFSAIMSHFYPVVDLSPEILWGLLALTPVVCYLAWRAFPKTANICLPIAVISIASLALQVSSLGNLQIPVAMIIATCSQVYFRSSILLGIAIGGLLAMTGPIAMCILAVAACVLASRDQRMADSAMHLSSQEAIKNH